jgi:DNA-binding transcriptional LysR family regulator
VLVSDLVNFRLRAVAGSDLIGVAIKGVDAVADRLRLKVLAIKGPEWTRPVAIAYRKDVYLSPAARRLIDIRKTTARTTGRTPPR